MRACYSLIFLLAWTGFSELVYNRDIRPILSDKCFACHGFDAKHREGDLRLDTPEAAYGKGKSGAIAIVPGKPEESELWQRIILAESDDDHMPPLKTKKSLSDAEKATLRQWIEQGATYQKHWAFEPPQAPKTGDNIDHFINAKLNEKQLSAAPEAPRHSLIRRIAFALTGLPPSLEELDAFLADDKPGAYERMVDRYLASQHYGEEMSRHWLDIARYADTHGMHLDNERQMYSYRDWVVGPSTSSPSSKSPATSSPKPATTNSSPPGLIAATSPPAKAAPSPRSGSTATPSSAPAPPPRPGSASALAAPSVTITNTIPSPAKTSFHSTPSFIPMRTPQWTATSCSLPHS